MRQTGVERKGDFRTTGENHRFSPAREESSYATLTSENLFLLEAERREGLIFYPRSPANLSCVVSESSKIKTMNTANTMEREGREIEIAGVES